MDGQKLKREVLTNLRKRAVPLVQTGDNPEDITRSMGYGIVFFLVLVNVYTQS
jgi:hypothetical protein